MCIILHLLRGARILSAKGEDRASAAIVVAGGETPERSLVAGEQLILPTAPPVCAILRISPFGAVCVSRCRSRIRARDVFHGAKTSREKRRRLGASWLFHSIIDPSLLHFTHERKSGKVSELREFHYTDCD